MTLGHFLNIAYNHSILRWGAGGELPTWKGRQGVGLSFEHCRLEVMDLNNTILLAFLTGCFRLYS